MSISSRPVRKAWLKKFKLCDACCLFLAIVLTVGISGQISPAASHLPSNQQVIAFLTQSIEWYRHRAIERQIATDPVDLAFLEDNRLIAAQIVQLSLDFARADASFVATSPAGNQQTSTATANGSSPDLSHYVQMEEQTQLAARQTSGQIEELKKKLVTARGADRGKLQAALDATQSRLDLLQAAMASLQEVIAFVRGAGGRESGDLASSIEDLARTFPDVTTPTALPSPMLSADMASIAKPRDSGILGLSSQVSALARKLRLLDDEIRQTDILRQSSQGLRNPLLAYINQRFSSSANNDLQASDLQVLQQEKAQLDSLRIVVKALAPAIVALDKQNVLLGAYTSHLKSWRATVASEDEKVWKNLLLRVAGVAVVIGALLITGTLARRATRRHVRDVERRHIMLVILRVIFWFTIVVAAVFAFTSDWTSLATFFGLLAAGVAVALQSVMLTALGYFVLVGRRGIRIGDRVQISGVTGDVTEIGWIQFQVKEIDNNTQQPTGRVVTFSNSFVFVSPATGLSKFSHEEMKRIELELTAKAPQ
jgi:small-conductance mechanosensitive channel